MVLFPRQLLSENFGSRNYDWITEAFGLLCLFSGLVGLMVNRKNDDDLIREYLKIKLVIEIILLGLMVTANKNILGQVGAYGLVLCIAINSYVLCRN